MGGRHRKKVPIARRVFLYGLILSAIVVLGIAFLKPTGVTPTPVPAPVDSVVTSTTTTVSAAQTPTTTKHSKKKRSVQSEKDSTPSPTRSRARSSVTPRASPSIKSVGPREAAVRPRAVAPVTLKSKATPSPDDVPVIERSAPSAVVEPRSIITTSQTPRVIPTPRVISPAPLQQSTSTKQTTRPLPTVQKVTTNPKCGSIGLLDGPKAACNRILALFPQVNTVLGVGQRVDNPNSCHPKGLAIDLIVGTNKALGDRLYAYVISQRSALGATPVVLWQVPDHFDHVHVSFAPCKG